MRTRSNDPQKVKELMDSISEIGLQVPVSSISPPFYAKLRLCKKILLDVTDNTHI